MNIYTITDWLGLIPIFVCITFGIIGLIQLIKRKHLFKVDFDILILGIYYLTVIFCYLFFEMNPINYRPILIDGYLEASYPSSTTLLVLGVMPSAIDRIHYRIKNVYIKRILIVTAIAFSSFMVLGRLISGVHWITDIIGAFLFSSSLFCLYKSIVNK
jgi:undecaprenyl-diphosphatase